MSLAAPCPAMYAIRARGEVIGHSELEHGDAPMGVAFGRFVPAAGFKAYVRTVPPNIVEDSGVRIWNELTASTPGGVAVFRVDLGDEIAHEVNVLGIHSPPYGELFPQHVEAYERRFGPPDA